MTNAFGGFLHTSPLSNLASSTSRPPDPHAALASNCVRDHFGAVVQSVADALHARGPSTLHELVSHIRQRCLRDWNEERGRLVDRLNGEIVGEEKGKDDEEGLRYRGGKLQMNKALGSAAAGYITDASHVRAALIVLLHHSLVRVSGGGRKPSGTDGADGGVSRHEPDPTSAHTHYTYTFLAERARLLPRYPRYVQHAQHLFGETTAQLVECLLDNGRMRAEDTIASVCESAKRKLLWEDGEGVASEKELADNIVGSFQKLVEAGYVERIEPVATNRDVDEGAQGGEAEFGADEDGANNAGKKKKATKKTRKRRARSNSAEGRTTSKKQRAQNGSAISKDDGHGSAEPDSQILALLAPLRTLIPAGSVYRVNVAMFHASLRAKALSQNVAELYPDEGATSLLKHVGAIVHAALTFAARQEHGHPERVRGANETEEEKQGRMALWGTFAPSDIAPYLSAEATQSLQSKAGGLNQNLSIALVQMSAVCKCPPIVTEIEEARGHPQGGKFELSTRSLLQRMRERILHRALTAHHGLVAARIASILEAKGHLESDAIAEDAMLPAKEAREVLHRLHRDGYIDLCDMHVTKTHNTGTAIYLWNVVPSRLSKTVVNNVCLALLNLRLRRQHEVEAGKEWMNRAKEGGSGEENWQAEDKKKYHAFCKGLERLDCACLQLDETLMVLKDF
ncbi:hypothetical protein ACHAXT_006571 [Thalassiosira profunda]